VAGLVRLANLPCRRAIAVGLLVAALTLLVTACGDDGGGPAEIDPALGTPIAETSNLSIYGAFVPEPAADIGALYFTMVDRDGKGDRLLGVTTAVALMTHLHSTVTEGDTSRMLPVEGGIVLPPNGMTELAPGGLHVMLMNLSTALTVGDTIQVTLQFERAGAVTIDVPVVSYEDAE
jgi:periplasmic copper chaperone A